MWEFIQLINNRPGLGSEICPTPEPKILAFTLQCLPQVSAYSRMESPWWHWWWPPRRTSSQKDPDNECFNILGVVRSRLLPIHCKNKNDCNCSFKIMHLGINIRKQILWNTQQQSLFQFLTLFKILENLNSLKLLMQTYIIFWFKTKNSYMWSFKSPCYWSCLN